MMNLATIRECIGAKRFVWIDDEFGNTPQQLGKMLIENKEAALSCGFNDINEILEGLDADFEGARDELVQHLADRDPASLPTIRRSLFAAHSASQTVAKELDEATVGAICELLEVAEADRHHFDDAEGAVADLAQDDGVCFVIDLMDVATRNRRGLDVVRQLAAAKSKGVAFILTHETTMKDEARFEEELGHELEKDGGHVDLPICVIAKERLLSAPEAATVQDQLAIALKRAGLRKCMHEVLRTAQTHVGTEFAKAARNLLLVPPETLDAFAIERAYVEGLSELHVVERALSAHMSKSLRHLFGTNKEIKRRADVMRRLRDVPLETQEWSANPILEAFQQAEIFEGDELINSGLTPIACGDVFETFKEPTLPAIGKRRFLLVGQPCDIALRSDGTRDQEAAYLVPINTMTHEAAAAAAKNKLKEHLLPFAIDGKLWVCNLRAAASARLSVLDLASLRPDGRVQADDDQVADPGLLPGLRAIYDEIRTPIKGAIAAAERAKVEKDRVRAAAAAAKKAAKESKTAKASADTSKSEGAGETTMEVTLQQSISSGEMTPTGGTKPDMLAKLIDPDLLLTLARDDDFRQIHVGLGVPATTSNPGFVTWRLKRTGRIQMPFATAILDALTGVMTRRAYELDFAKPKVLPPAPQVTKPPAAGAA